jgi:hypothetical protein
MRFNNALFIPGLLLIALLIISWQADKGGRMGVFQADSSFPSGAQPKWQPPAVSFRSTGCCTDDVRSAIWNGRTLELYTGEEPIRLFFGNTTRSRDHYIPGASDVLGSASACGRVWLPETRHQRLLEVTATGEYNTEVGSNQVGSVNGIAVVSTAPLTLVLTTGPRDSTDDFMVQPVPSSAGAEGEKLYLSRAGRSRPMLVQVNPDTGASSPLNIGEELWEPSGISVSSDEQTMFVADERRDELAWIRISRGKDSSQPWVSTGKIARFPLSATGQRGIARGLVVLRMSGHDYLAGATPDGLTFMTPDGRRLGVISTSDPISRLVLGDRFGTPLLYAVAGRAIWEARLHNVDEPRQATCPTR